MAQTFVPCASDGASGGGYVHEAFFYRGDDEFLAGCVGIVDEGLRHGEHAVVAVVPQKLQQMRAALGQHADQVTFVDMAEAGRNPGRIIQVWRDLVDAAEERGAGIRGMVSPSGRETVELSDAGHTREPMVGRLRPRPETENGRGVWIANQLCDLVQTRSTPHGTVVRLHMELGLPAARVG